MKTTESQNKQILHFLKMGGKITQLHAFELFNCWRLSGRIFDLKRKGHPIKKNMLITGQKRYAEYYLD